MASAGDRGRREPSSLQAALLLMWSMRGRARQLWRVFDRGLVPMVMVDNERRHLAANAAARLVARLSLAELLPLRIDDLTPQREIPLLHEQWARLMRTGEAGGHYDVGLPDGTRLRVQYSALANILPGQHLIVFAPAAWPEDELGAPGEGETPIGPRKLSIREREVLSLVAAGLDLEQIARDLTISVSTVRTHARNALRRLAARNRAHAVALAMRDGLIELPPDPVERGCAQR